MITGKTSTGFEFKANDGIKNDFRFVETLAALKSENASDKLRGQVELVNLLLGKDGKTALFAHVRLADGTVPTDRVLEEVNEIILAMREEPETKN